MSNEAYVLYNAITMISQIETDLFIIFRAKFQCLEIICHVVGINEDVIHLYLDYSALLPFLPNDMGKDQTEEQRSQKRINTIVDCLLKSLELGSHPTNPLGWCLSIRKDSVLEAIAANTPAHQMQPKRRASIDISTVVLTQPPEGLVPYDISSKLPSDQENSSQEKLTLEPIGSQLDSMLGANLSSPPTRKTQSSAGLNKILGKVWLQSGNIRDSGEFSTTDRSTPRASVSSFSPRDAQGDVDNASDHAYFSRQLSMAHTLPEISTNIHVSQTTPEKLTPMSARSTKVVALPALTSTPSQRHVYDFFFSRANTVKTLVDTPPEASSPASPGAAESNQKDDDKEKEKDKEKSADKSRRRSFGQQISARQQSTRLSTITLQHGSMAGSPMAGNNNSVRRITGIQQPHMSNQLHQGTERRSTRLSTITDHQQSQAPTATSSGVAAALPGIVMHPEVVIQPQVHTEMTA
eukprot:scaffold3243_cov173-Ochromonas_danica.AAC.18